MVCGVSERIEFRVVLVICFFFQAEDGIRDMGVTGVQTCALPISHRRTFVLDTPVLLADPGALLRMGANDVVLPLVVIRELEDKRNHPELGWSARQALRLLDDLRVRHGRLDAPVPVGEAGGTLHVELNHSDPSVLPAGFRNDSNDSRIMVVALNLRAEGRDVCLITKDVPLRVKAAAVGLATDEYRAHDAVDAGWTGMAELSVDDEIGRAHV